MGTRYDIPPALLPNAPEPAAPELARVLIVSPRGEQLTVHPSQLQPFLDAGYQTASPFETEDLLREQKFGSQNFLAGVEGLARGASLGLYDIAAETLGYGFEADQRAEQNPYISTTTEILGAVGPALIPGGQFAPAGALSRAGMGLSRLGAEGSRLARVGYGAAGAALEGGVMSVGLSLGESARRGESASLAASEALRHGALGVGLGAAGGALFTGGEMALRQVFRKKAEEGAELAVGAAMAAELENVAAIMKLQPKTLRKLQQAEGKVADLEGRVTQLGDEAAGITVPPLPVAAGDVAGAGTAADDVAEMAATDGGASTLQAEYQQILDSYTPMVKELESNGAQLIIAKREGADKLDSLAKFLLHRAEGGTKDAGIELAGNVKKLADDYIAAVEKFDDVFATRAAKTRKGTTINMDLSHGSVAARLESNFDGALEALGTMERRGAALMAELERVGLRTTRNITNLDAADLVKTGEPLPAFSGPGFIRIPGELEPQAGRLLGRASSGLDSLLDENLATMMAQAEAKFAMVPAARAGSRVAEVAAEAGPSLDPIALRRAQRRIEAADRSLAAAERKLAAAKLKKTKGGKKSEAVIAGELRLENAKARAADARDALAQAEARVVKAAKAREESAAQQAAREADVAANKAAREAEVVRNKATREADIARGKKAMADRKLHIAEEDLAAARARATQLQEELSVIREAADMEGRLRPLVQEIEPMLARDGVTFGKKELQLAAIELGVDLGDYAGVIPDEVAWLLRAHLVSKLMTGRGIVGRAKQGGLGRIGRGLFGAASGGVGRGVARLGAASLGAQNPLLIGGLLGFGGKAGRDVADVIMGQARKATGTTPRFLSPEMARAAYQERVARSMKRLSRSFAAPRRVLPSAVAVLSGLRFAEVKHEGDGSLPDLDRHFERRAKELEHVMQDPEVAGTRIAERLVNRGVASEENVSDVIDGLMPILAYLYDQLPKPRPKGPLDTRRYSSRQEIRIWTHKVRYLVDPASAAEDLADGIATAEGIGSVREAAPDVFASLQGAVLDQALSEPNMTRATREYVSMTMDLPLALSFSPASAMAAITADSAAEQQAQSMPGSSGAPGKIRSNTPTTAQRLQAR